jgi:type VI secretion system protein ImpA
LSVDTEAFLAPITGDVPGGPDLTYDPEFMALEQAAQGKSEQQFGDTVIPAEEPNWRDVRQRAEALLERSKDLRVAVLLARALTRMEGMEGLAAGLEIIRELLVRYWDTLHPALDHDDNDDPTMRLNALGPLSDAETFLREIRSTDLVASAQHGRVSVRDVLVATGKLPAAGESLSESQIDAIVRAVSAENPAPAQAALSAAGAVVALESVLSEKGVLTQAPDLRPLNDVLHALAPFCSAALGTVGGAGEDAESGDSGQPGTPRAPGEIRTREDAVQMLENICRFIERSEPSNPAPLLIRRAQRLMSRSFVEIIQELAPESLDQIQKLAGLGEK